MFLLLVVFICSWVAGELAPPTNTRTIAPVGDDVPILPSMVRRTPAPHRESRMMQDPHTGTWRMVTDDEEGMKQQKSTPLSILQKNPPPTYQPEERIGDEMGMMAQQVVAGLIPGATGEFSGAVMKKMAQGIERRRSRQMAQDGIKYDPTTAKYRSPIGLPCDPRKHPLLCQLEEDEETTTTTRKPPRPRKHRRGGAAF